jgi:protein-tyrosine phosphatase
VYRAAALHHMTPADLERFEQLGIRTTFDLRSAAEHDDSPDPVPSVNVPVLGRFMEANERPDFAQMVGHDHGVAFMRGMVVNMLHWGGPEIGSVIAAMADDDELPVVFHCMAGKDRTGIVAALLLAVLGVDRELILDDFELTDHYRAGRTDTVAFERMLSHGMPPEAAAGALGAPRELMAAVFDELDQRYGTVERYLIDEGGLSEETISRLRTTLLT